MPSKKHREMRFVNIAALILLRVYALAFFYCMIFIQFRLLFALFDGDTMYVQIKTNFVLRVGPASRFIV